MLKTYSCNHMHEESFHVCLYDVSVQLSLNLVSLRMECTLGGEPLSPRWRIRLLCEIRRDNSCNIVQEKHQEISSITALEAVFCAFTIYNSHKDIMIRSNRHIPWTSTEIMCTQNVRLSQQHDTCYMPNGLAKLKVDIEISSFRLNERMSEWNEWTVFLL